MTLPNSAKTETDIATVCQGIDATYHILANDYAYDGGLQNSTYSTNFIDNSKTNFYASAVDTTPLTYKLAGNIRTYNTTQSTWKYDNTTGILVFSNASGFTGTAQLFYNVIGSVSPVNHEIYRSGKSEIRVVVDANCCVKTSTATGISSEKKIGILTQENRREGWPENQPNGVIALESKDKGFVITRVANADTAIPAAERKTGMLVFDIGASCFKLWNVSVWKCLERKCNN